MKKSLRFWIVPLFLLAGLAMGACNGDFPLDINSEEGIKDIFSDLDVDDIEFTGAVQDISLETWMVSDLAVGVTPETDIDDEIATGDVVKVKAVVFKDGSLLAVEIESDSDKDDDLDVDNQRPDDRHLGRNRDWR
jgi:hypothetical protein